MEFFKNWKNKIEGAAKAGAVVAALGGAPFIDGAANQAEAQTVLQSAKYTGKLNFFGFEKFGDQYKANFEKWLREVVMESPVVQAEVEKNSKMPNQDEGIYNTNIENIQKSRLVYDRWNGLPTNLQKGKVEKIYITIFKSKDSGEGEVRVMLGSKDPEVYNKEIKEMKSADRNKMETELIGVFADYNYDTKKFK